MIIGASIQVGDEIMHRSKIVAISAYLPYLFLLEALDLYVESAEILGDPYSKKSPLQSIGNSPCLAISPKDTSYRDLASQEKIRDTLLTITTLEY